MIDKGGYLEIHSYVDWQPVQLTGTVITFRQARSYVPSHGVSSLSEQYQIIQLADRGT